jgi:predicted methyltransferase
MKRSMIVMALMLFIAPLILPEAQADTHRSFADRVQSAMEAEGRPDADKARDANRMPLETLAFIGVDSDQRVLELLPGGGWYTRLLAPALDGTGKLYLAFGGRIPDELKEEPFMKKVEFLEVSASLEPTEKRGIYSTEAFEFDVEDLDAVLTFRNLHNLAPETRRIFNEAIFSALRPGGVYGVIDHTRRHNEPDSEKNYRRLDPVLAIEEIQAAGFVFEGSSNLHARPADSLVEEVGHESVTGKTDRFTLRFRKPTN